MEDSYNDYKEEISHVPSIWRTLGFVALASFAVGIFIQLTKGPFHNIPFTDKFVVFMGAVLGSTIAFMFVPLLIVGVSRGISAIRKRPKANLTLTIWISWAIVTAISTLGQLQSH